MYSSFRLATKYFRYYLTASNGKGHGVHSPFVFDFIAKLLNDKTSYPEYASIEDLRKQLMYDNTEIEVEDMGAGSLTVPHHRKKISAIARSFLKQKKYAQLLYRMVKYYKPSTVIELGTSLGITTAYLAAAGAKVYTLEGAGTVAKVAGKNLAKLGLHAEIIEGNFDDTLPMLLQKIETVDLAFIDGNHRKVPTLNYFNRLMQKANDNTILIFDDIHWSSGMEEAWNEIKEHPDVTLTIDLFFIGVVFVRKEFRAKQDFIIRF